MKHCDVDMWLVEHPEVWDGALYFECPKCGTWAHRFEPGDYRRERGHKANAFPSEEKHHPDDPMHSMSRIRRGVTRDTR